MAALAVRLWSVISLSPWWGFGGGIARQGVSMGWTMAEFFEAVKRRIARQSFPPQSLVDIGLVGSKTLSALYMVKIAQLSDSAMSLLQPELTYFDRIGFTDEEMVLLMELSEACQVEPRVLIASIVSDVLREDAEAIADHPAHDEQTPMQIH